MNSPRNLLTLLLLAAAAASAPAHALTRAQVEAQLAAAQRNGTVVGKLGVTDRQLRPWLYPPAAGAGQTRAVAAGPSSWRAGALTRCLSATTAVATRGGGTHRSEPPLPEAETACPSVELIDYRGV